MPVDLPREDDDAGFERYVEVTGEALDGSGPDAIVVARSRRRSTRSRAWSPVSARIAWPLRSLVDARIGVHQSAFMREIAVIDERCCPPIDGPLDRDEAERLAGALRVLADPARLRLISFIAAHAEGEACVCDLTEPVGLSQPTVSHHLKVLTEAGLLEREKRGRWVYFRLRPEPIELLRGALSLHR